MKYKRTFLLFLVSFVFVALFSRSTSFLYVYEGFDAAIFKQMGLALLRGKTLYVDYFDNKGCILYFIQALGLWLGGNFGLMLLQTLSLTVTLALWDKTLALFRDRRSTKVCIGIALLLLLCFYEGGDLSEEWCLPFASYPIWLYFRALKQGKGIKPMEMFAVGLCFGVIAFIRINNATPLLGFVAYAWLALLRDKSFNKFLKSLSCFLAGLLLIVVAVALYFCLKAGWHGVNEMFYASFLSNFEYIATQRYVDGLAIGLYFAFVGLCIALQCLITPREKDILVPVLLSYAVFLLTFGTRCFTHYLMSVLPLLMVLLMTARFKPIKYSVLIVTVLACFPLAFYLIRPVGFFINDVVLGREKFKDSYAEFHRCVESIPKTERDSIYNYNLAGIAAGMMQHEGLLQCNRVIYSTLAFDLATLHREEISKPFTMPLWILASGDKDFNGDDAQFILKHYELKSFFEHNTVYLEKANMGELTYVCFYRRKDQ